MQEVYNLIMQTLKDADIAPVYALGAYEGSIDGRLIIVEPQSARQYMNYSTTIRYFNILCYGRTASEAVKLCDDVQEAMKALRFTVMPTYTQNAPYWNNTTHGWRLDCIYRNYAKND